MAAACALLVKDAAAWVQYQDFRDWQNFCHAFTKRFGNSSKYELTELMDIRQGTHEDIEDFVTRFNAKVAAFDNFGNPFPVLVQKKLFIDGLLPNIGQKVVDRRPQTFTDAAHGAQYFAILFNQESLDSAYITRRSIQSSHGRNRHQRYQHVQHSTRYQKALPVSQAYAAYNSRCYDQSFIDELSNRVDALAYQLQHLEDTDFQGHDQLELHDIEYYQPLQPHHAHTSLERAQHVDQHVNPYTPNTPDPICQQPASAFDPDACYDEWGRQSSCRDDTNHAEPDLEMENEPVEYIINPEDSQDGVEEDNEQSCEYHSSQVTKEVPSVTVLLNQSAQQQPIKKEITALREPAQPLHLPLTSKDDAAMFAKNDGKGAYCHELNQQIQVEEPSASVDISTWVEPVPTLQDPITGQIARCQPFSLFQKSPAFPEDKPALVDKHIVMPYMIDAWSCSSIMPSNDSDHSKALQPSIVSAPGSYLGNAHILFNSAMILASSKPAVVIGNITLNHPADAFSYRAHHLLPGIAILLLSLIANISDGTWDPGGVAHALWALPFPEAHTPPWIGHILQTSPYFISSGPRV